MAVQLLRLRDRHSAIYSHKSTQFSSFLFLMRNVLLLSDLPNKRKRGFGAFKKKRGAGIFFFISVGEKTWRWKTFI